MTKLEQFKAFLTSLESDKKEEILTAFIDVEGVFNEAISSRDKAKESNRALKEQVKSIGDTLGLSDEFTNEDIKSVLSEKNTDAEKIKSEISAKYEEKYSTEFKTLTEKLQLAETNVNDVTTKYNDSLFNNAVSNGGLLNDFVDEPMARQNITNMVKEQLIYRDGKIFVKDATTGDIATKLGTNEPLEASEVINNIKATISPIYLKAETKAQGTGMPNQVNSNQFNNSSKTIDTSKYKSTEDFIGDAMKTIKQ